MSHNPARRVHRPEGSLRELELYIDNEEPLYRQSQAIQENLLRKMAAGRYDYRRAPKLWLYLVDEGARRYVKEFGGSVRDVFPLSVRKHLAKSYAAQFLRKLRSGEVAPKYRKNAVMVRGTVSSVNAIAPATPYWMR